MKKFDLFDKVEASQQREQLPVGGYKVKILKAEEMEYSWGTVVVISFDIADGEYKDFFKRDYNSNTKNDKKWRGTYRLNLPNGKSEKADEFNARQFKTFAQAVEKSNSGYKWTWDEATLKDKFVGLVFGEEEYSFDGRTGMMIKARYAAPVEGIANAKVPAPKMLNGGTTPTNGGTNQEEDDDLPF